MAAQFYRARLLPYTHQQEVGGPDHLMSTLLDVVLGILEELLYFHIENNMNLIRHLDQYTGNLQIITQPC